MRLTTTCGVAGRLNLLTHWPVCCAVSAAGRLACGRDPGDGLTLPDAHGPKTRPVPSPGAIGYELFAGAEASIVRCGGVAKGRGRLSVLQKQKGRAPAVHAR